MIQYLGVIFVLYVLSLCHLLNC